MSVVEYVEEIRHQILDTPHVVSHSLGYEDRPPTRRHRKRLCHIYGRIVYPLQRVSAATTSHHEAQVRIPLRYLHAHTDVSLRQRPGPCRATPLHIPRPSAYSRRSPFIFRPCTRLCPARSSGLRQALPLIVVRPLDQRGHRPRRLI
jgi:hypothetical protein